MSWETIIGYVFYYGGLLAMALIPGDPSWFDAALMAAIIGGHWLNSLRARTPIYPVPEDDE